MSLGSATAAPAIMSATTNTTAVNTNLSMASLPTLRLRRSYGEIWVANNLDLKWCRITIYPAPDLFYIWQSEVRTPYSFAIEIYVFVHVEISEPVVTVAKRTMVRTRKEVRAI